MAMAMDADHGAGSFEFRSEQMTDYIINQDPPASSSADQDTVVRMRGLPFSATEADVEKFFEGFNIVMPDGIIMGMSTFRARPNGDAYVMFATNEEREKAMAKDRQQIGQRYIELFRCTVTDFEQAKRKRDAEAKAEDEAHVFTEGPENAVLRMRGLPFQAALDNVVEFFNGYGLAAGAESIKIIQTADGRNSGEAYVQFNSAEESKRALENLNKQNILSRYVELFESSAHEARQAVVRSAAAKKNYESNAQDVYVRVRGLPYSIQYREIRQFFAPAHICSNGIHLMHDNLGRIRGDAYIQFVTPEDAKIALTKNRETLQSRYIEVFPSSRAQMVHGLQVDQRFAMGYQQGPAPYMQGNMGGPQPMYRGPAMYRAPATAPMYGAPMQQQQQQQQNQQRYANGPYPQPNRNMYQQQQQQAPQANMYQNSYPPTQNRNPRQQNGYANNYQQQGRNPRQQTGYNTNYAAAQQGYNDYVQQQQAPQQQYYQQTGGYTQDVSGSNGYTGYDNTQQTQWSYGYANTQAMDTGRRNW